MNTSMYDAWTAYDATAVPTRRAGWSRRPAEERTLERKSMAISYAAHRALSDLFPSLEATFTAFRTNLGYTAAPSGQPDDPATIGTAAADAVIAFRAPTAPTSSAIIPTAAARPYADYTGYAPDQPTHRRVLAAAAGQTFIVPHWQLVTPFALTSANQFVPPGPKLKKQRRVLQEGH